MGSNLKRRIRCAEDRLSELPDEVLYHILSFLSTVEAVKTCVFSHRWEKVWESVPVVDVCDYAPKKFDRDSLSLFLDGVLFAHDSLKVRRYLIQCTKRVEPLLFDYWISTAVGCNVDELQILKFFPWVPSTCHFHPSVSGCLQSFTTITPEPSWFPSLKFLHVSVARAGSHLMENLFTCFPVLEELEFDAAPEYDDDTVFNINISAPELKRIHIYFLREINFFPEVVYGLELVKYEHKLFFNANAPNLETFKFEGNLLAIYSSSNAKSLKKAKIDCARLHPSLILDDQPEAADNLHRLFTGTSNVMSLSVSAPNFGDPNIVYQYRLPTFVNLKHLKLRLQSCCSWQPLISFLNASPNLESLVLKKRRHCLFRHKPDELQHEWSPPESVPACLLNHLKNICIRGYKGMPDQLEVVAYLLNYGKVLNKMTVHRTTKCLSSKIEKKIRQELKELPRASKTCQFEIPCLSVTA